MKDVKSSYATPVRFCCPKTVATSAVQVSVIVSCQFDFKWYVNQFQSDSRFQSCLLSFCLHLDVTFEMTNCDYVNIGKCDILKIFCYRVVCGDKIELEVILPLC